MKKLFVPYFAVLIYGVLVVAKESPVKTPEDESEINTLREGDKGLCKTAGIGGACSIRSKYFQKRLKA
ncbi:MAG: hypothetical protein GDA51_12125 [Ekhidna sp.]|nr:hypothetical protein [Ekhidna sp.]MBC6409735.1 hypothetical protein [Ekhidna sp.]MBC6427182.1 hypothetical protein [Ekhidna sp.]